MSDETFLTTQGDDAVQVPVEKREAPAVVQPPKIEEVVVSPTPEAQPREFYCSTCKERYSEDKVMKMPLDYVREEDGSFSKAHTRFSVFCPRCQKFLVVIDEDGYNALQELLKKHSK